MKRLALFSIIAVSSILSGCGKEEATLPPMPVSYVTAEARNTPILREYVGQVQAVNEVSIRPRVSGIVVSRTFQEGGFVRKGQALFNIDPREFRAQVAGAEAQLAAARASAAQAGQDVARYGPLVKADAIAKQVYDNAVQAKQAAEAQVRAARANVDQAKVGLSYTVVLSPISGRIGEATMDVGSLASPAGPEMARVSDLDPISFYFRPSEQELLEYQKQSPAARAAAESSLKLVLADGTNYPFPGRVDFADRSLNPATGSLEVRAVFPNSDGRLMPGMFGRVVMQFAEKANAIVIPDRAVIEQLGTKFVYVVAKDSTVEQRKVEVGPSADGNIIVTAGLKAGEKVLVDGLQKVQPGMEVAPKPLNAKPNEAGKP